MSVEDITIGDPFFSVKLIKSKKNIFVNGKAIVLNLSNSPLKIRQQVALILMIKRFLFSV